MNFTHDDKTLYRFLVYCILKWKLGSKLYRLLEGEEVLFNVLETKEAKSVITVLLQVEFKGNGDDFVEVATDEVLRVFSGRKFEKLHCTREAFLGYFGFYYFRKCEVSKEEYIKEFQTENFKSALGRITNAELPNGNKAMWDVHISKIKYENCFPIVFRFHQTVGDAVAVLNMFAKDFSSNSAKIKLQQSSIRPSNDAKIKLVLPTDLRRNDMIGALTGEKHLVWFTEKEPKYLSVIEGIKHKHKITFTDVLVAGVSTSLREYCEEKKMHAPNKIFIAVALPQNKDRQKNYELSNKFSIGFIEVPLVIQPENLVRRLLIASKEYNELKNESIDLIFNQWQLRVPFKFLPVRILKLYVYTHDLTAVLSNIPGCSTLEMFNGSQVKDFVVFNPNYLKSGISIMATTYENRLNLVYF